MARLFNVYQVSLGKALPPKLITILEKDSVADAYSHAVLYYGHKHGDLFVKPVRYGQHETARQYMADRKRRKKG